MHKTQQFLLTALSLWLASPALASESRAIHVTSASPDAVYVDAGTDAGLRPGDLLLVRRENKVIAEIEVAFVGDTTAGCGVLRWIDEVRSGDQVLVPRRPASQATISAKTEPAVTPQVIVAEVTSETIYLSGGSAHGLAVGQTVVVERQGEEIAELEVLFLSERSASCRIVRELREIRPGDSARALPLAAPTPKPPTEEPPRPESREVAPRVVESPPPAPRPPSRATPLPAPRSKPSKKRSNKLTGTLSARWHGFEPRAESGGQRFSQTTTRLNLRLRQIAGSPYEFRLRLRGRENRRIRRGEVVTDRRDRLYEVSVNYAPKDGRYSYFLGRLGSGPLVGFDYLDGAVGELKIGERFRVGGLAGMRSDIESLGFDSTGNVYGAFARYRRDRNRESPFYADILVGGLGEYRDGEVDREYLSTYTRLGSGGKWSVYQRAEIDLNRDWRQDLTGKTYQLSNLLFSGTYRFSEAVRLGISYDQRQRFRDLDNRDTPEERFDDQLRDGGRVTLFLGRPRGWRASTSFGLRRREGSPEDNLTATGSIFHSGLAGGNLLVAFDFSGFSGETSEGYRLGLRARKYFRGGHELGVTVGQSSNMAMVLGLVRTDQWLRISGSARLPKKLFLIGEIELSQGDDLEGQRLILEIGYRL